MKGWLELRHLPRRVWVISVAALINRLGTMALPFMTLYLTSGLGWPAPRAAAVLGLYGAVSLVAGPFAGRLSDRFGAARVMQVSLAASAVLTLLFPLARSLPAVAALTVVWSMFTEAFRPANMTAITESVDAEHRKQAYALHRAAINVGMSVGPAAGGFLATISYSWLWWADGATSLLAALLLWRGLGEMPKISSAAAEQGPSSRALSDPRMLAFVAAMIPLAIVFFQHESALPLDLTRRIGASPKFYGLLFTVNTLLIVATEIPLNHATEAWSHARALAVGALLFAFGFGGYGLASGAWGAVAATVVWTFGEMTLMPGASNYVAAIAPERRRGEYMGIYIMSYNVGFMLGPWLGVLALERWGPSALWGLSFALAGLSAAFFARLGSWR